MIGASKRHATRKSIVELSWLKVKFASDKAVLVAGDAGENWFPKSLVKRWVVWKSGKGTVVDCPKKGDVVSVYLPAWFVEGCRNRDKLAAHNWV